MWLHPRRCGSGRALAVSTNGLLRAATCLGLRAGTVEGNGRVHRETADDGLRAGGCKCRADNTRHVLSLTPGRRRGGQRRLHTRVGKKACVEREHKLYFGKVFSFGCRFHFACLQLQHTWFYLLLFIRLGFEMASCSIQGDYGPFPSAVCVFLSCCGPLSR